jgi:hypothetical protein
MGFVWLSEDVLGYPLAVNAKLCLAILFLGVGAFLAWRDKHKESEGRQKELVTTKTLLQEENEELTRQLASRELNFAGEIENIATAPMDNIGHALIVFVCLRNLGPSGTVRNFVLHLTTDDGEELTPNPLLPIEMTLINNGQRITVQKSDNLNEKAAIPIGQNDFRNGWIAYGIPKHSAAEKFGHGRAHARMTFKDAKNNGYTIHPLPDGECPGIHYRPGMAIRLSKDFDPVAMDPSIPLLASSTLGMAGLTTPPSQAPDKEEPPPSPAL